MGSKLIDEELLKNACQITGGQFLTSSDQTLELEGNSTAKYQELWPSFLLVLLALFIVDLIIRRWENVLGIGDVFALNSR